MLLSAPFLVALNVVAGAAGAPADVIPAVVLASYGTRGNPNVVTDGELMPEGTNWDTSGALQLADPQSQVTIDLGAPETLAGILLQGDDNDFYPVEGSLDGADWKVLIVAAPSREGAGLRTRALVPPGNPTARYLRIRASGGDGSFSLAEVRAYRKLPSPWPPKLIQAPRPHGWAAIDNDGMVWIEAALGLLGTALLGWGWLLARRGRPDHRRRLRDYLLGFCGLFSFICFFNIGHFHFDRYLHIWEHYHYYIGAKYFREIGYTRLYQCTAAAEIEQGFRDRVAKRKMRNLTTNHLESSDEIVADPTICTSHFTPERWTEFKHDIAWFRNHVSLDFWNESQKDHGYNGTPVWGIAGGILANTGPASDRQILLLGILDAGLLVLMWIFVWWAFGWRHMCVGLLYWGVNFPARYYWNGGAFLRMDWLAAAVIGVCLLKKAKPLASGFLLALSAMLRIFPGLIVVGLAVHAGVEMRRLRRFTLSKTQKRLIIGGVLAGAILIPASGIVAGGMGAWPAFVENSRKHLQTPLTNNVGLKTMVAFDWPTRAIRMRNYGLSDPFETWKAARLRVFHDRRIGFFALVLAFLILLARAVEKEEPWVAAALGVGLIPICVELTCYYYSVLLILALLCARRAAAGWWMVASATATAIVSRIAGWDDECYFWVSAFTLIAIIAVTTIIARDKTPAKA